MPMSDRQFQAARLKEMRDIAKRVSHIEDMIEDILELHKIEMNKADKDMAYFKAELAEIKGVQESFRLKTLDDICDEIVGGQNDLHPEE